MSLQYPGLRKYVSKRLALGVPTEKLWREAKQKFGYENNVRNFGKYCSKIRRGQEEEIKPEKIPKKVLVANKFLNLLQLNNSITIIELCNELNCPPRKVYSLIEEHRNLGYEILYDDLRVSLGEFDIADVEKYSVSKDREIKIGIASDLHFGSQACQITRLHEFTEVCKKSGVKHIFVPGDITAGINVYRGQEVELYAHGAEEQENSVIKNLPTGVQWIMLGGNHDYSFVKTCNHNPLLTLQTRRKDIVYVGFDDANVEILDGVDLKLWHPIGSPAYALSYKIQKRMDRLGLDELNKIVRDADASTVKVLLVGHFHSNLSTLMGGILALQCGAFEGRTNLTERMGVTPTIGGWILRIWFNGNDVIDYEQRFWTRPEIPHDWKNYSHTIEEPKKLNGPVFG